MFIKILLVTILIENITELIAKSQLFQPVRKKVIYFNSFLGKLIQCGQCLSVWVAAGVVLLLGLVYNFTGWYYIDLTLTGLIVHRLSNYLHNFNDKFFDKYYSLSHINSEKTK